MAVTIYQLSKPWLWVEAVAGGNLAASTTYYFIGFNAYSYSTMGSYYGYAPGPSSDQVSVTTDSTNKKILMEVYQLGGYITGYANAGGGLVRATTSVAHGLSNGATVYLRGTANYKGAYTISNVTSTTFDFTDTWVSDDGASNWYSSPGIPANIHDGSSYYCGFHYKWDYYSMLRGDGSKFQWLNTNDPTYSDEWYHATSSVRLYGHRRWGGAYYHNGMRSTEFSTAADGSKYRYLDAVSSTATSDPYWNTTTMYDGGRNSIVGYVAHPEIALRKWYDAAMTKALFQLPEGMTEDCAGCVIYIDNSDYLNTWAYIVAALKASGAIGKSVILTNDNESPNTAERSVKLVIRGLILQESDTFTTQTVIYDKSITLLHGRIFCHAYNGVYANKLNFNGCDIAHISLSSGYRVEPSFTAKNTKCTSNIFLYTANLNSGMINFSPFCWSPSQPTTYTSLTDYNFLGSGKYQNNNAQVIRYLANGMYARRMTFTWCVCYPVPSVAGTIVVEYTDITFYQPQSDDATSGSSSIYNSDFVLSAYYMSGKDGNYTFNCYNVTSPDRADKIVRVNFNDSSSYGYTASTTMIFKFHFPVNVKIVDEDGNPIEGATVTILNSNGTPDTYTDTTDADGDIDEQNVLCYTVELDSANTDGHKTSSTYPHWSKTTMVNDLTVEVSKPGYESYSVNIDDVLEEQTMTIALKTSRLLRDQFSRISKHQYLSKVARNNYINSIQTVLNKVVNKEIGMGISADKFKFYQIPTPVPDGSQTLFTLSEGYRAGTLTVYRDQLALQKDIDFEETSNVDGTFTFLLTPPLTGEKIWCNYIAI